MACLAMMMAGLGQVGLIRQHFRGRSTRRTVTALVALTVTDAGADCVRRAELIAPLYETSDLTTVVAVCGTSRGTRMVLLWRLLMA